MSRILPFFSRWPLWLQLVSAMVAASLAVAMVAGEVLRAIETDYLRDELRRESLRTSEALTFALVDSVAGGNVDEIESLVERTVRDDARIHSVALIDAGGRTVSRWVSDADSAEPVFYYSIATTLPDGGSGKLVLSWNVAGLVRNIERHVDRLQFDMFVAVGVLGGLLIVLLHFLVVRPVERIGRGLDALARGESEEPVRLSRIAAAELDRLAGIVGELGRYQRALRDTQASLEHARGAAEAASEAKGRFLAVMSHEIRTPLNSVIGSLELLDDAEVGPTERNLIVNARRSAESLLAIINEILDFSRVESGRLTLEDEEYPLESQLDDVARGASGLVDHARVELVVEFDPALPERVRGDPLRLRQIVTNLLGNACKFTAEGSIVLAAKRLDGERLRIEVRDSGIGIPVEQQAELFQPFTQADSSTSRKFGGTGLGLSICKQLVELMGGAIGLESRPGEGSCFWMNLPLRACAPPRRFDASGLGGERALLAVACAAARRALAAWLEDFGLDVIVADEPGSADGPPAARFLVVDAALASRGDGIAALRDRYAAGGARVVLLVSPGSPPIDGLAFDAALSKPIERAELHAALRRPAPAAPAVPRARSGDAALGSVLLVDDNAMNLEVAAAMLARLGLAVDTAGSGEEAVARAESGRYDVVLMDEQMPGIDGLEATRRIRRGAAPACEVPIVALTANADEASERRCLDAGMDGFLPKPVRRKALGAMLARFVPALASAGDGTAVR